MIGTSTTSHVLLVAEPEETGYNDIMVSIFLGCPPEFSACVTLSATRYIMEIHRPLSSSCVLR